MNALKVLNAAAAHFFSWVWNQAQRNWGQVALCAFLGLVLDIVIFAVIISNGWGTAILIDTVLNMFFWGLLSLGAGIIAGGAGIATERLTPGIQNDPKVFAFSVWGAGSAITLAFGGVGSASLLLHTERSPMAFWTLVLVGIVTHFLVKDSTRAPVWLKNFFENVYITTLTIGFIGTLLAVIVPPIFRTIMHVLSLWCQGSVVAIDDVGMKGYSVLTGAFGWLAILLFALWLLSRFGMINVPFKRGAETAVEGGKVVLSTSVIIVAVVMLIIILFVVLGGGGHGSLVSGVVGFPKFGTGHIIPFLVVVGVFFILGSWLLNAGSSVKGNAFWGILGVLLVSILITAFAGGCAQGIMGMHPSQNMTSELGTPPNTTGWYQIEFEILPHRISTNEKIFGLKVPRGDVLPYLFEDGTKILIVHNDGYISSNLGKALADRTLEGYPYKHPCKADSMLPYPNQLEVLDCFVSTRYACDTCQVQRPVLSFETPGGQPCTGEEIKTGKVFTVHGTRVAVGRVNSWYDGQPIGKYREVILCSRKPRPYTVVTTAALLPKPGTMLTTSSPFRIRVFLLYYEYRQFSCC